MSVQAYLFYNGCCEEALEFYHSALGANIEMMLRYRESPTPLSPDTVPPGAENKIMHASFTVAGTTIMASDGHCSGKTNFEGFSLSISVSDVAQADRCFNALAQGGQVTMPLAKTFWSACFGMLTDRFGVSWMVNVTE